MRTLTGMLIVIALFVGFAAVETSAADTDLEHLKERLDAQARRIKTLEAHVAVLRKKIKRIKADESDTSEKSSAAQSKDNKSKTAVSSESKSLHKLNSALHQWNDYHYIKYKWRQRKGWDVIQGQEKRAYKLVGNKRARWSRIMHKHEFKGDFSVSATVLARGSARMEIVHPDDDKPYKKGFRVDFPDGKPTRIIVQRKGDSMTATINGAEVELQEKHYGGDVTKPCYVALTVDKGDTLLLRNVQLYGVK